MIFSNEKPPKLTVHTNATWGIQVNIILINFVNSANLVAIKIVHLNEIILVRMFTQNKDFTAHLIKCNVNRTNVLDMCIFGAQKIVYQTYYV